MLSKVIILPWSNGLDSCLWSCSPGFNSPAGSFTCFLQIFKISQTLRAYSRFQRTLGKSRLFQSKVEILNYPNTLSKLPARPGTSMKIILENQVFTKKTLLKIEQGFESQTFQLNFDSLKSFKMLETPRGINIHPKVSVGVKKSTKWKIIGEPLQATVIVVT